MCSPRAAPFTSVVSSAAISFGIFAARRAFAIAPRFIDGATNRVVAEYADTQYGRKYVVNTSGGVSAAVSGGVTNYLDAYKTWAHAQQAFDQWSQILRQRMDQLTGR